MHPSTSLTKFAVQTSLSVLICGPFYLPYTKSKELRQARATTGGIKAQGPRADFKANELICH